MIIKRGQFLMSENNVPKTISDLKMYCWSNRISEYECRVSLGEYVKQRGFTCLIKSPSGKFLVFKTKAFREKELMFCGSEAEACAMLYSIILTESEKIKKKEQFWASKPVKYVKKAVACFLAFILFVNITWAMCDTLSRPRLSNSSSGAYVASEPTPSGYYLYKGKLFFKTCFGWARFSKRDQLWYTADADSELENDPKPFYVDEGELRTRGNLIPYDWTNRIPTGSGDIFGDNMEPSILDQILNQGEF